MTRSIILSEGKSIVQVVLPRAWVIRINQLAVERGLNRSALIREALQRTFCGDGEPHGDDTRAAAQPKAGGMLAE
ncbi:MAG: CopG family transcriptional regulator [Ktedonobacterales bacterium]